MTALEIDWCVHRTVLTDFIDPFFSSVYCVVEVELVSMEKANTKVTKVMRTRMRR